MTEKAAADKFRDPKLAGAIALYNAETEFQKPFNHEDNTQNPRYGILWTDMLKSGEYGYAANEPDPQKQLERLKQGHNVCSCADLTLFHKEICFDPEWRKLTKSQKMGYVEFARKVLDDVAAAQAAEVSEGLTRSQHLRKVAESKNIF